MAIYEIVTVWATILSPIIAVGIAWWTVKSSNKSTMQMLNATKENSRVTSSEHLSLYRIEAFYNEVAIRNINYDINVLDKQLKCETDTAKRITLQTQIDKLRMNLQFMNIRRAQLIQNDFTLQSELKELFKDSK